LAKVKGGGPDKLAI